MKKIVATDRAPKAVGPYSQAVDTGETIYLSGQIPLDPATGQLVEGDIRIQTEQVMKNLEAVLEAAGCSFADVVKCTCLLADMADFPAFNEVYAQYFPADPPARATFAVQALPLGASVEVDAVVVRSAA